MNRRDCLAALAGTVALTPLEASAAALAHDPQRWARRQRRQLRQVRAHRGDADVRRALAREGLPRGLHNEVLAALVLAQAFQDLTPKQRRQDAVQDLMWEETPRIGQATASWVSWLDGLSPERRRELDDHLHESPETLDLADGFVAERTAGVGEGLDRKLRSARRALRRRSIRWGLETLLSHAVRSAGEVGLGDEAWRGGGYRGEGPLQREPGDGPPPPRRRRRAGLPPIIAWGLRVLGVGLVFVAFGYIFVAVGAFAAGAVFLYVGVVMLLVGLVALFWGLIAIGLGLHVPPAQRRRGKRPPPRRDRPPPR